MLIEKISLTTMAKFIQVKYNNENNLYLNDIKFTIKHKYDQYTWLINIDDNVSENLNKINKYLCENIENIKSQCGYIKNNNIILKIRNKGDKVLMNTNVNIYENLADKELIGSLYLDQIWLYKGMYCYKWKLDNLRFEE